MENADSGEVVEEGCGEVESLWKVVIVMWSGGRGLYWNGVECS